MKNQGISTLYMQSCHLSEWELFFAHFVWFSCLLFRGDYKQTKGKTAGVWGQDGRKSSGLKIGWFSFVLGLLCLYLTFLLVLSVLSVNSYLTLKITELQG